MSSEDLSRKACIRRCSKDRQLSEDPSGSNTAHSDKTQCARHRSGHNKRPTVTKEVMDEQDDEHYTSGEGAPASYIPKPVQFVVATACTALVVFVLVIACCLAKSQCAWHEPLVRVAKQIEGTERRRRRAEERQRRRALRETEVSPLQRGAFATIAARLPSLDSVLGRQTYLQVWKGLKARARNKTNATYFGYPTVVWFFMWLLYATFNGRKSTGGIEQYLALSFVFVLQSTDALCAEKAAKLRESLRAMGLRTCLLGRAPDRGRPLVATALGFVLACVVTPCRLLHNAGRGNNVPASFAQFWEVLGLFRPRRRRLRPSPVVFRRSAARRPRHRFTFALTIASVVCSSSSRSRSRPPSGTTTLSYGLAADRFTNRGTGNCLIHRPLSGVALPDRPAARGQVALAGRGALVFISPVPRRSCRRVGVRRSVVSPDGAAGVVAEKAPERHPTTTRRSTAARRRRAPSSSRAWPRPSGASRPSTARRSGSTTASARASSGTTAPARRLC